MTSRIKYLTSIMLLFLSLIVMTGCDKKKSTIDTHYDNYLAIVEDIAGNKDGVSATADQINSLIEVSGARDNLDYAIAFILGKYENREKPTPEEIQTVVDAFNRSADVLIQIGEEGDKPDQVKSVVTIEQLTWIIPPVLRIKDNREALYQAYIDTHPDKFSEPATQPEVQAMIDAVEEEQRTLDTNSSTITANPTRVKANGTTKSTITVVLKTKAGNPLKNEKVVLDQGKGASKISKVENKHNGTYLFYVTSTKEEKVTYRAKVGKATLKHTASVTFTPVIGAINPNKSTVKAKPTTVVADGKSISTITVTLKDSENQLITDGKVSLKGNGISTISKVTNEKNGKYTFTVTSTKAGAVKYTAKADGVTIKQTATVTFVSTYASTVEANPPRVEVGNIETSTVTVVVKDENDNRFSNAVVTLTEASSLIEPSTGDAAHGIYRFKVSSDTLGIKTYHATAKIGRQTYTIKDTATVEYIEGEPSDKSELHVDEHNHTVNETTTVTLILKSEDGTILHTRHDVEINLDHNLGFDTNLTFDPDTGKYTITFHDVNPETDHVVALIDGTLTLTDYVKYIREIVDLNKSTLV
ncbi:MAG: hypothetical protein DSZ12_00465, partial [Sulfurovum sp.]